MGHKNVGKSVVNSKICFTFEKVMLKSPTFFDEFVSKTQYVFLKENEAGHNFAIIISKSNIIFHKM